MRCSLAVVLALVASCSHTRPRCDDCGGPMIPQERIAEDAKRRDLCARAAAFRDQHCSPFDQLDPALLADCSVVDSLYIADADRCMLETGCDALQACLHDVNTRGGTFDGPTRPCGDTSHESVPAGFGPEGIADSIGRTDRKFGDTVSSKEHPIEVCGMPDQLAYLTRVSCANGSKPFASRAEADAARVGSVGRGGRCERVIDKYLVTCPEQTYQVFIDPYRCPLR